MPAMAPRTVGLRNRRPGGEQEPRHQQKDHHPAPHDAHVAAHYGNSGTYTLNSSRPATLGAPLENAVGGIRPNDGISLRGERVKPVPQAPPRRSYPTEPRSSSRA